tara:strand:- start:3136 stop:3360 length:225 start_codon:yes stop_codon:yes gene_type:complete
LAAQHDVQTIFGAADELEAFLRGSLLPMRGVRTFEDLLELPVNGKGICDFAKGHQENVSEKGMTYRTERGARRA